MKEELNQIEHFTEIRSEEVQEILTKTPGWIVGWGNMIVAAILLVILAISWFVK